MCASYNFCNNCGKNGHAFHQCKQPITSIGVIAYRCVNGRNEYLMIRRKDSLGYVDFIRGKYPLYNYIYIKNIIDEMTEDEKNRLLNDDFDTLWETLWGDNIGIQYRNEEKVSKDKLECLKKGIKTIKYEYNLQSLIKNSKTKWQEPEWGFPKGRRNFQEKDLSCALREFEEETGYPKLSLKIIQNLNPFEEIFTGSNYKSYKHKYFIANMDNSVIPTTLYQETEVSKIKWMRYETCIQIIRPYNLEKKDILKKTEILINKYTLY